MKNAKAMRVYGTVNSRPVYPRDEYVYPDSQHNLSAYSKEYFEKHENAFYDAFIHNLDTYSFDEWTTLEEFLNMSLSYDQYMAIAYYCNADEEIDGEILEISEFANRKKDLLDVAKNATHA